jgi:hypothetical protein
MVNIIDSNLIHWCDVQGQEITIKVTDRQYSSAAAACIIFDLIYLINTGCGRKT